MLKAARQSETTYEMIAPLFHLPIAEAAEHLAICPTLLKNLCRDLGLPRWPYRQIQSLANMIEKLEAVLLTEVLEQEKESLRKRISELREKRILILSDPRQHHQPLHQQRREFRTIYKKHQKRSSSSAHTSEQRTEGSDDLLYSGSTPPQEKTPAHSETCSPFSLSTPSMPLLPEASHAPSSMPASGFGIVFSGGYEWLVSGDPSKPPVLEPNITLQVPDQKHRFKFR